MQTSNKTIGWYHGFYNKYRLINNFYKILYNEII